MRRTRSASPAMNVRVSRWSALGWGDGACRWPVVWVRVSLVAASIRSKYCSAYHLCKQQQQSSVSNVRSLHPPTHTRTLPPNNRRSRHLPPRQQLRPHPLCRPGQRDRLQLQHQRHRRRRRRVRRRPVLGGRRRGARAAGGEAGQLPLDHPARVVGGGGRAGGAVAQGAAGA